MAPNTPSLVAAAEKMTDATGIVTATDDIIGHRAETTGDLIVVTRFGNKARITTDGAVELLVGPGAASEIYEPPEFAIDEDEILDDLPPLEAEVVEPVDPDQLEVDQTDELVDEQGDVVPVPAGDDDGDAAEAEAEVEVEVVEKPKRGRARS